MNVQPGGISRVAATAVDSFLTTSFSGNLNVTLDSGTVLTIPVTGTYEGESTSPVVRPVHTPSVLDNLPLWHGK